MDQPSETITFVYECTPTERKEGLALMTSPTKDPSQVATAARQRAMEATWGKVVMAAVLLGIVFFLLQLGWVAIQARSDGTVDSKARLTFVLVNLMLLGIVGITIAFFCHRVADERRRRCWNNDVQMSIGPGGVVERYPGAATTYNWGYFRGVDESTNVFILRTSVNRAFIVPRRLFTDDAQVRQVIALARRYAVKAAVPIPKGFEVIR
jgi:hypothetical protein